MMISIRVLLFLTSFGIISSAMAQTARVSLAPYLSLRGSGSPSLSPDGKWIVFPSSVSGTSQLWKIPAEAAPSGRAYWPEQLTFFADAVGRAQWSPDGKWLLFRK